MTEVEQSPSLALASEDYPEHVLVSNITKGLETTVSGIIETGRWLCQAKGQEPYKSMDGEQWNAWLGDKVQMTKGTASKFMTIYGNPALRGVSSLKLPPHYPTLYTLARIPGPRLQELISSRQVTPYTTGADAETLRRGEPRATSPGPGLRQQLEEAEQQISTLTSDLAETRRQLDGARDFSDPDVIQATAVYAPGLAHEWTCMGCEGKFTVTGNWWDWESLTGEVPVLICNQCHDLLDKALRKGGVFDGEHLKSLLAELTDSP